MALLLYLLTLFALAPAWFWAGKLASRLKLPLITGYLLAGVASGPDAFGLISADGLAALGTVDHLCLSLIALAAGAELQLAELHKIRRQVTWITLGISVCTWVLVFACALALGPYVPFMALAPPHAAHAMASLVATLAVARSPASAIAVLKELEGKGPYCSLVMAVVVLKDVLVFAGFAVNIELAKSAIGSNQALALEHLVDPLISIAASLVLGLGGGLLLGALRQPRVAGSHLNPLPHMLPGSVRSRLRVIAPLAVSGCTFFLAESMHAEPLLACVTAGLVVANTSWFDPASMELLMAEMTRLMRVVNVAFFGLVGASLKLAAVRDTLWAAALLFLARLVGIWLGCYAGAAAGGAPEAVGGRVWMGMVTQAGVALGLARVVRSTFPEWGADFSALAAGVVLMNLFTGPPLFKAAVVALGEAQAIGLPALATEFDGRVKRDPSRQQLGRRKSIPEIPIISVLQPGADALMSAGSSLKQLVSTAASGALD